MSCLNAKSKIEETFIKLDEASAVGSAVGLASDANSGVGYFLAGGLVSKITLAISPIFSFLANGCSLFVGYKLNDVVTNEILPDLETTKAKIVSYAEKLPLIHVNSEDPLLIERYEKLHANNLFFVNRNIEYATSLKCISYGVLTAGISSVISLLSQVSKSLVDLAHLEDNAIVSEVLSKISTCANLITQISGLALSVLSVIRSLEMFSRSFSSINELSDFESQFSEALRNQSSLDRFILLHNNDIFLERVIGNNQIQVFKNLKIEDMPSIEKIVQAVHAQRFKQKLQILIATLIFVTAIASLVLTSGSLSIIPVIDAIAHSSTIIIPIIHAVGLSTQLLWLKNDDSDAFKDLSSANFTKPKYLLDLLDKRVDSSI